MLGVGAWQATLLNAPANLALYPAATSLCVFTPLSLCPHVYHSQVHSAHANKTLSVGKEANSPIKNFN